MPVLLSYRSQPIDLLYKSIDWFLYEGDSDTKWVKGMPDIKIYFTLALIKISSDVDINLEMP